MRFFSGVFLFLVLIWLWLPWGLGLVGSYYLERLGVDVEAFEVGRFGLDEIEIIRFEVAAPQPVVFDPFVISFDWKEVVLRSEMIRFQWLGERFYMGDISFAWLSNASGYEVRVDPFVWVQESGFLPPLRVEGVGSFIGEGLLVNVKTFAPDSVRVAPYITFEVLLAHDTVTIREFNFDSAEAAIYVRDEVLDFSQDVFDVTFYVRKVDVSFLDVLLDGKLEFDGALVGKVPVRFARDGAVVIAGASLGVQERGVLRYVSDHLSVTAEGNPGLGVLRQALEAFHYEVFRVLLDGGSDGSLEGRLMLYGFNPSLYDGRRIELNVHLTGDVLDAIRAGVSSYQLPETLIKQVRDEE